MTIETKPEIIDVVCEKINESVNEDTKSFQLDQNALDQIEQAVRLELSDNQMKESGLASLASFQSDGNVKQKPSVTHDSVHSSVKGSP